MGYTDALATNLRIQRARINARQQDVAAKTGIDQSALSQYENGQRVPSVETVTKLADFYHVTLDALAGRPSVG